MSGGGLETWVEGVWTGWWRERVGGTSMEEGGGEGVRGGGVKG